MVTAICYAGSQLGQVRATDIHPYGYGEVRDFLAGRSFQMSDGEVDWVITNPPFKLAEEFIIQSLDIARRGVAMLVRTVFLESVGCYERLFQFHPPTFCAQFTERVPMVKGRVDPKASTATGYCWIVWQKPLGEESALRWIRPCRRRLERAG